MTAVEALSAALDQAATREQKHLNELSALRATVRALERRNEKLQDLLWEQTRLVDELSHMPAREVVNVA